MALWTTQVTVGTSATQIVPTSTRNKVTITNTTTTPVYIGGDNTVTTSTGQLIPGVVGASETYETSTDIWGIVATGTTVVTLAQII